MECANCGLVPEQHSIDNTCPFCGGSYPATQYVPTVVIPSREHALKMRDLSTGIMQILIESPLSDIDPQYKDFEKKLYHWMKEDAEKWDELANRE